MRILTGTFALVLTASCAVGPSNDSPRAVHSEAVLAAELPFPLKKIQVSPRTGRTKTVRVTWRSEEPKAYTTGFCKGAESERGRLSKESDGGSTVFLHVCVFDDAKSASEAFQFNVESLPTLTDLPDLDNPESAAAARMATENYNLHSDSEYLTCGIHARAGSCGAWIFLARYDRLLAVLDVDADAGGFASEDLIRMVRELDAAASGSSPG